MSNDFGTSTVYTDLFIIDLPFAFEKNEFKLINSTLDYKKDLEVSLLIEDLSFFETSYIQGLFTPAERDKNKIIRTQEYFELMIKERNTAST
ncbi:MAG: hypothetical protein CMO01_31050 [Thalassobius sp.]|nr:hypothetical protein [Thalassovita sp.]